MRRMVVLCVMAFVPLACNGQLGGGCCPPTEESVAGLVQFASADELQRYFLQQGQMAQRCRGGGPMDGIGLFLAMPASSESGADGGRQDTPDSFSQTNIQEAGVDEADVVKTDGVHFFIAAEGRLRIVKARPPEDLAVVGQADVPGRVEAMYLYDGKAVVLSSVSGIPGEQLAFAADGQTAVTVFDVSEVTAPTIIRSMVFDGWLNTSRRIEGRLRLILNMYVYDVAPQDPEAWLPKQYVDDDGGRFETMGQYDDFYHPVTPDGVGITCIVSVDLDDLGADPQSVSVLGDAEVVYASREALYLSDSRYGYGSTPRETTVFHKFDLSGDQVVYAGSGSVTGRVLNSFSLGEHEGYLRVATTVGWMGGEGANALRTQVHVLGERGSSLKQVGVLDGLAPGEDLYAARFMGNRGFLITFVKVDPLFVLDLSNPGEPRVAGELEVPGYGEYIHPMGENHLITLGKDADVDGEIVWYQGVQLCLFDVSDPNDPQLLDRVVLGTRGTESEALNDHHAFNYFADQDTLAVPICLSEGGQGGPTLGEPTFRGLYVYRVTPGDGFELLGRLATQDEAPVYCGWWSDGQDWTRSVFVDSDVYAVTSEVVRAAPLADVSSVPWSLDLP
ncbi:MAG TPA: beta-propeller domain-containing protein [Phycisphaerae bacterium]|nr:beta-propeller domain-containing protein [Phycisphaerae bacterium]